MTTTELHFDRESAQPWHLTTLDMGASLLALVTGDHPAEVRTQIAQTIQLLELPVNGPIHVRAADLTRANWDRLKNGKYRFRKNLG